MRKAVVLARVGNQIHIERVMQVGLDHQQRAFGPERLAFAAVLAARAGPLAVADARQQHTAARMVVGHVFGRQHRELAAAEREQAVGLVVAVKVNLGAEVDARLAHQVFNIAKLVIGVAAAIRQDDEANLALDQRIDAAVLKMSAVRQIPPRAFHAKEGGRCLAGQHHRFGNRAPGQAAQPAKLHALLRRAHPVAQPHTQKVHQQGQPARGVAARPRRRGGA